MLRYVKLNNGIKFNLEHESDNYCQNEIIDMYNHILKPAELLNMIGSLDAIQASANKTGNYVDLCGLHPLGLFTECLDYECALNRLNNMIFRSYTEKKIFSIIKHDNRPIINYCSLQSSGGYLTEILILSGVLPNTTINLFMIMDQAYLEYIKTIQNINHNPNCKDNNIILNKNKFQFTNLNDSQARKLNHHTAQILKFLEWFKGLDIDMNLHIFGSVDDLIDSYDNDLIMLADYVVGIDYMANPEHLNAFEYSINLSGQEQFIKLLDYFTHPDTVVCSLVSTGTVMAPNIELQIYERKYQGIMPIIDISGYYLVLIYMLVDMLIMRLF